MGGTSMKDVEGAGFAGSSPFRGRKREAVDVDAGPDQVRNPAALATMKPVLLLGFRVQGLGLKGLGFRV